ncbi:MAG: O-methyltransferase, partial [Acidobacteriota bacterium]
MDEIKNALTDYAEKYTSDESQVLRELREHCYAHYEDKAMLSGFYQGRLLSMFSRMIRPMAVLEIGTYLGYSTICLAEGLAPGGRVVSLDVNEETNAVAQSFIDKTEFADRIQLRLGEAAFVMPHLQGPFDLVFIDADKPNYSNYYNLVFEKLRPGGFIIADNVLWSGKVLDEEKDENTQALHDFKKMVQADDRVS